ncbi:hypothetical protein GCM10022224_004810 [Nonomuraea antimicrobica]|uniref:Uncharacterized protein n=1 Tax=Nonomuraea antimicrobica TaxID=561173 RepID=A0ABP7B1P9_9ACTN
MSPHLPDPEPDHTRLTWFKARKEPRRRTLAWTCHCDVVVHELCTAGGQAFLRRTDLATEEVYETHRMSTRAGCAMWHALLSGLVR